MVSLALSGCASLDADNAGGIPILYDRPARAHEVIGLVEYDPSVAGMRVPGLQGLRTKAATMGADAVVLQGNSATAMGTSGAGSDMVTGLAIRYTQ
jgi:uncharacterized protein YbjQ (UPF0145 family)